jgi:hypothetical protein
MNLNKKRTNTDFSKHEIIYKEDSLTKIWDFKRPNSSTYRVTFINCNGVLAVTGDVGNWIFCREFYPSAKGYVSDDYWCEKLQIASSQSYKKYDSETAWGECNDLILEAISEMKDGEWDMEKYSEYIDWLRNCQGESDNEIDFLHEVYNGSPDFIDSECLPEGKKVKVWLEIVFDAFDEMCIRMRNEENGNEKNTI